jgi:hypothetical protein
MKLHFKNTQHCGIHILLPLALKKKYWQTFTKYRSLFCDLGDDRWDCPFLNSACLMSLCIQSPGNEGVFETALIHVVKYHSTAESFLRNSSCLTVQEMETEASRPRWHLSVTGPSSDPYESIWHRHTLFLYNTFIVISCQLHSVTPVFFSVIIN